MNKRKNICRRKQPKTQKTLNSCCFCATKSSLRKKVCIFVVSLEGQKRLERKKMPFSAIFHQKQMGRN